MPRADADIFRTELTLTPRPVTFKPETYLTVARERGIHKAANRVLRLARINHPYLLRQENTGYMFTDDLPGSTVQIRSFRREGPVITWSIVNTPVTVHNIAEATDITIDLQKDRISAQRDFYAYDSQQAVEGQLSQIANERPPEILDPYLEHNATDVALSLTRVGDYLRSPQVCPVRTLVSLEPLL